MGIELATAAADALVGALLLGADPAAVVDIDDMPTHRHRVVMQAIVELIDEEFRLDQIVVAARIAAIDAAEAVGMVVWLNERVYETPSVSGAYHYAGIVNDWARRRRWVMLAAVVNDAALAGDENRAAAAISQLAAEVFPAPASTDASIESSGAAHDRPQ